MEAIRLSTLGKSEETVMHRITNEALEDFLSQCDAVDLSDYRGRISFEQVLEVEDSEVMVSFHITGEVNGRKTGLTVYDIRAFRDVEESHEPIDLTQKQEKIVRDWFYGSVDV